MIVRDLEFDLDLIEFDLDGQNPVCYACCVFCVQTILRVSRSCQSDCITVIFYISLKGSRLHEMCFVKLA